jgi:hypothetical protein
MTMEIVQTVLIITTLNVPYFAALHLHPAPCVAQESAVNMEQKTEVVIHKMVQSSTNKMPYVNVQ